MKAFVALGLALVPDFRGSRPQDADPPLPLLMTRSSPASASSMASPPWARPCRARAPSSSASRHRSTSPTPIRACAPSSTVITGSRGAFLQAASRRRRRPCRRAARRRARHDGRRRRGSIRRRAAASIRPMTRFMSGRSRVASPATSSPTAPSCSGRCGRCRAPIRKPGRRASRLLAEKVLTRMRTTAPSSSIETVTTSDVPGLAPDPGSRRSGSPCGCRDAITPSPWLMPTEAGHFQRAGLPTVVCGPGSIDRVRTSLGRIHHAGAARGGRGFMRRLMAECRN